MRAVLGDLELLQAWRDGDQAAGSQLFDRHFESLYRFFSNKADDTVDDLIQQSFMDVVEARDTFRGESSFRTFLFVIARRRLYDYWTKRRRTPGTEDIGELSIASLSTSPRGVVAKRREQQLLARALREIPLELQITLELFYWEELSGTALARILDIPEGTVRSRLRRAREVLEKELRALAEHGYRDILESTINDLGKWLQSLREISKPISS